MELYDLSGQLNATASFDLSTPSWGWFTPRRPLAARPDRPGAWRRLLSSPVGVTSIDSITLGDGPIRENARRAA